LAHKKRHFNRWLNSFCTRIYCGFVFSSSRPDPKVFIKFNFNY